MTDEERDFVIYGYVVAKSATEIAGGIIYERKANFFRETSQN